MKKDQSLTRRAFLNHGACLAIFATYARPVFSEIRLGSSARVSTLSDGYLSLPPDMIFGDAPQDELKDLLERYQTDLSSYEPECNVTLYSDEERNVLFDVGAGPDFMPTAGRLVNALDGTGLSPDGITDVVFTHAHPDHIWGVLDDFGDPLFLNATYHFGRGEWDYWWDPATVDTIGDDRASFAVGAKRRMEAIEARVVIFEDGEEILPGVAARASFGHTPGHMAFEVRNGNDAVMIVGDALGNPHVAFERPDWHSGADQDPEAAAKARRSLLDQIAQDHMQIIGFHLPDGGIGRVEKTGSAYRFIGEPS